jgi:hypothetical protein
LLQVVVLVVGHTTLSAVLVVQVVFCMVMLL